MADIPFQRGSLFEGAPKVTVANPLAETDLSRRIVPDGEPLYRFAWELHYRSGLIRRQYERLGEHVVQTYFARVDPAGVREIVVVDLHRQAQILMRIGLPEPAHADILYANGFALESPVIERIYTFGWFVPGTTACQYYHVNPQDPGRIAANNRRFQ